MKIHIYTASDQPATRYRDTNGPGRPMIFRCSPRTLWYTDCCGLRRWAKYVRVQVFYDKILRTCAKGHGCEAKP